MVSSLVAPEVERRLREMAQADGRTLNAMIALILTRAVNAQRKGNLKGDR
jgi:predicted HicB family RNase H-like nuclease